MWMRTRCTLDFRFEYPTPLILMLRARSGRRQWIGGEHYTMAPHVTVREYTDIFGNLCQRLIAPAGEFQVRTSADVITTDAIEQAPGSEFVEIDHLPDDVLMYLLPSRYCESDRFQEMAREIVDGVTLGYDQVDRITQWLRDNISYAPGTSAFPVSAVEVNLQGQGVCRDLSHLGIALCRALSIPARLVVGYLYDLHPMDMHAWFEAYVNNRWYTFDATESTLRGGRLAVAYGRDAADVAIYTQFGPPALFSDMTVSVELLDHPPG